jgi:hypothetical protein
MLHSNTAVEQVSVDFTTGLLLMTHDFHLRFWTGSLSDAM